MIVSVVDVTVWLGETVYVPPLPIPDPYPVMTVPAAHDPQLTPLPMLM